MENNRGNLRDIYFAGGCFWGVEEYFSRVPGVVDTISGYANGRTENPTYEEVCSDATGFAETVHVKYNPEIVGLKTLTALFFEIIDPVSVNRQGSDSGTQYRTGIYYTETEDKALVEAMLGELQKKYVDHWRWSFASYEFFMPQKIIIRIICERKIPAVTPY